MEVSQTSIQPFYMKDLYKQALQNIDITLTRKIKDTYAEFLRHFSEFFLSDFHNDYLHNRQTDWKTEERSCSTCRKNSLPGSYSDQVLSDAPFLTYRMTLGIASCKSNTCWQKVQNYIRKFQENVGPFLSNELAKTNTYIDDFGNKITNYDTLYIPGDKLGWHFESMHITYNSKKEDIIIVVDLARRNIGRKGYITVPLEDIISANRDIDYYKVIQEMPDTIGGFFVKHHIEEIINPSIPQNKILEFLECPIEKEVMEDPVIGPDGHTYERLAIRKWVSEHHSSPLTRKPMEVEELKPNFTIKKIINFIKGWKKTYIPQNKILQFLECPIVKEVMEDPVVAPNGYTYERFAIRKWISEDHSSPLTRKSMEVEELKPNFAIKKIIDFVISFSK